MRLSEIMAMANQLAGCAQTPADSQVYLDGEVRRVFVGIDVDVNELLLARSLGADGVIAHHPIGSRARLGLPAIIERHEAQMRAAGISEPIAHEMMLARQRPVAHALHTTNYDRVVDAARHLAMPMMNIHLAADIIGRRFFIEFVNRVVDGKATLLPALSRNSRPFPRWRRPWCNRNCGWERRKIRLDSGSCRWPPGRMVAQPCIARIMSTAMTPSWPCTSTNGTCASSSSCNARGRTW
jgi:hypothetical protein